MAKLSEITRFLNRELKIKKFKDSSRNGLQVSAKKDIKKIGFAVDACMAVFEKAKKTGCDLVIVHHGIFWKGKTPESSKKQVLFCRKNKIAVYASHLPLDAHEKYGNNIQLANILKLKKIKKFGLYHGTLIGYSGKFSRDVLLSEIAKILNKKIGADCRIVSFGKKKIRSIGIISGGGDSGDAEAAQKTGLDCFLTGDSKHSLFLKAQNIGMNIISAGHYATETTGVMALMQLSKEKFKVQAIFIENPTGL